VYPTIALVGRPNVGKSTLFNKLTRRRDALVANVPGLTRDRRYGLSEFNGLTCNLVDTGGLFGDHELAEALAEQTMLAVDEADLVIVMFDGREGVTPADEDVVGYLRKHDAQYLAVVNKIDGVSEDQIQAEFTRFGFSEMLLVSASHNRGIGPLQEAMVQRLRAMGQWSVDTPAPAVGPGTRVAVVGRPNVGKSTLVNRLIGERRQVVYDMPGTTRDAIDIPFSRDGHDYVLIDTAGVRRKGRVEGVSEKFSVVKALDAMRRAQVVVLTWMRTRV
jgi:GTP-binding protein